MHRPKSILTVTAVTIAIAGAAPCTSTDEDRTKEQVRAVLRSLGTGVVPPGIIDPDNYVQHNLNVPDGLDGFEAYIQKLPRGHDRVKTARVFQDGDFVF